MKSKTIKVSDLISEVIHLLKLGKAVEIIVTGNSMLPLYKHGKTIVRLKAFDTYKKHDVVLFKYMGNYVLHRIIKIKKSIFILRGDGAFRKEMTSVDDIYGKVVDFHTKNKRVMFYKYKYKLWLLMTPFRRIMLKLVKK